MTLETLMEKCQLEAVVLPDPTVEIVTAYCSDLLSDVVAHCPEDALLITVQNHNNSIAVCTLVGAPAILLVHGRTVPAEMSALAQRESVALLRTSDDQYHAVLKIGRALGCCEQG